MDDMRTFSEDGNYLLEIWETNKGPSLSYCKWSVSCWVEEVANWYTLEAGGICTYDVALCDGNEALKRLSKVDVRRQEPYTG